MDIDQVIGFSFGVRWTLCSISGEHMGVPVPSSSSPSVFGADSICLDSRPNVGIQSINTGNYGGP